MNGRAAMAVATAVLAVAVVAAARGGAGPAPYEPPPTVQVQVDLATRVHVSSAVGLLHGATADAPAERWITPLRPALWRGAFGPSPPERIARSGARLELVLSDLWGYPGLDWYGRVPPWTDLAAWEAFVAAQARTHPGGDVVWDVWNEPDRAYAWTGTQEQLFETYRVAARTIQAVAGPSAVIAGPSVSTFRWDWLAGLVRYCAARGCPVNVLTWHELGDGCSVARVVTHARKARRLQRSRSGRAAGIRELQVNEVLGHEDTLQPGEQAAALAYLERAGVTGAARACWQDPDGTDTCAEPTLDGLLDHDTGRPRSVWWVMKAYADGVRSRVASSSGDPSVVALGARRPARVLLGYFDTHRVALPATIAVEVRLHGLGRARRLRIALTRYADSGAAPVAPGCERRWTVPVRRGVATLTVSPVRLHEAVLVALSPVRERRGDARDPS